MWPVCTTICALLCSTLEFPSGNRHLYALLLALLLLGGSRRREVSRASRESEVQGLFLKYLGGAKAIVFWIRVTVPSCSADRSALRRFPRARGFLGVLHSSSRGIAQMHSDDAGVCVRFRIRDAGWREQGSRGRGRPADPTNEDNIRPSYCFYTYCYE